MINMIEYHLFCNDSSVNESLCPQSSARLISPGQGLCDLPGGVHKANIFWDNRGIWSHALKTMSCKGILTMHPWSFNTLRLRQNGRRFADDTFKRIFLNENVRISIKISLKFVPKGPINNIPALVQILAWRRSGDNPLSEPMMVCLLTHICVARPQWFNTFKFQGYIKFSNCSYIT